MSATTSPLLTTIPMQISIYLGCITLVAGVLGGIMNIIVFLSLRTFRQSSCAIFLTVMSFVNIGQLLTSLLSRILITGFELTSTESNVFFCKFRIYCLHASTLISYTCMCLATIDQYLATSGLPFWRTFFTIKRAYIACTIAITVWLLHGIPSLIFYNPVPIPPNNAISCSMTNAIFQQYLRFGYALTFTGILPITITVVFGSLAYRNVRQIPYRTVPLVRREHDKQLTSMVLIQVLYNFIVITPYVSVLIILYSYTAPANSPTTVAIRFATFLTGMLYYFYFAVNFQTES